MKKVLIIDDNKNQQYLLSHFLTKYFECEILTADNGEEGLESIQKENPDLVILDIAMPKMDGVQCLQRIRLNNMNSTTPVIISTGMDEKSLIFKLLALGISDYLMKPFNLFSLYEKVKKHVPANSFLTS
ncbi:MAG: response regulator [Ignavibacteriales bacterium]|nr:response regulator [Ignavibacteriales bacterium]